MTLKQRIAGALYRQVDASEATTLHVREGGKEISLQILEILKKEVLSELKTILHASVRPEFPSLTILEGPEYEFIEDDECFSISIPKNDEINAINAKDLSGLIGRFLREDAKGKDQITLRESDENKIIPSGTMFSITIGEELRSDSTLLSGVDARSRECDLLIFELNFKRSTPLRSFLPPFLNWMRSASVFTVEQFNFGGDLEIQHRMPSGE